MIDLTSSTIDPMRTAITDHSATVATIDLTDGPITGSESSYNSQVVSEVASAQVEEKHHNINGSVECSGSGEMKGGKEDHLNEEGNGELFQPQPQLQGGDRADNGNHNPVNSASNGNAIMSANGNTQGHVEQDHMNGNEVFIKSDCVDIIREDDRKGVEDGGQSAVLKNEASTIMECDPGSENLDPVNDLIFLPKREGDRSKVEHSMNGTDAAHLKESVALSGLKKTEIPTVMTSTSNSIVSTASPSSSSVSASASASSSSSTGLGGLSGPGTGAGDGSIASKFHLEAHRRAETKRKTNEAQLDSKKMHDRQRAFLTEGLTPDGEEMDISTLSRIASMAAVYLHLTGGGFYSFYITLHDTA